MKNEKWIKKNSFTQRDIMEATMDRNGLNKSKQKNSKDLGLS